MPEVNLEEAILQFVCRPDYRSVKPRVIAKHLHISKERLDELKRAIKQLIRRGQIAYGPSI